MRVACHESIQGAVVRVRRLVLVLIFAVSFSCAAVQDVSITVFWAIDPHTIVWAGDGESIWTALELEYQPPFHYSRVLRILGQVAGLTVQIADDDSLSGLLSRLSDVPIPDQKYIDFSGDFTSPLLPYYPSGHIFSDRRGLPMGVVLNNGGELSTLPLESKGEGYITPSFIQNGTEGYYQVVPIGDGLWGSTFTPSWDGGIDSDKPPTESVGDVNPSGSIVNGGDTVFNWQLPSTSTDGDYSNVVSYPTYNAGSVGGANISMIDYSSALSVIGSTLQNHALANNEGLKTINENLQKQLEIDDGGELQVAPLDMTEYDVDTSEVSALMDEVSGWDYSFGMDQNVIGDTFSRIFGNPPTAFGSQDMVWDVDFPLFADVRVKSTFNITKYFPPAFRSMVLMFVTLYFAIVYMKTISGAFK